MTVAINSVLLITGLEFFPSINSVSINLHPLIVIGYISVIIDEFFYFYY